MKTNAPESWRMLARQTKMVVPPSYLELLEDMASVIEALAAVKLRLANLEEQVRNRRRGEEQNRWWLWWRKGKGAL